MAKEMSVTAERNLVSNSCAICDIGLDGVFHSIGQFEHYFIPIGHHTCDFISVGQFEHCFILIGYHTQYVSLLYSDWTYYLVGRANQK